MERLPVIVPGVFNEVMILMAKRLVVAFDIIDEDGNSLINGQTNDLMTPLAINSISPIDITRMWMALCNFSLSFRKDPLIRHLFHQTPYGISMEPDSKVTDKSDCIYFETHHGHTSLVHLPEVG